MKICIICSRLSYGGAERVAVAWANGFSRKGYEVMVITNLYAPITYQLDKKIEIRHLVSTNHNKLKKWLSSFGNVRKNLKKYQPNAIIGVLPTCSFVAKIASIGLHIPLIATEHDSFERPESAPFSLIDKVLKFCINKIYGNITVLTGADKDVIGTRLSHIHVMPNPLVLQPVITMPLKRNVILAAGRLDAWHVKGFDVLIKAFAKLVQGSSQSEAAKPSAWFKVKNERWKLQITGTGSSESQNYLKQLCKENGVEDYVEFQGFRKDVEKLYQDASIFVLSSRFEGFGLVLIEAMSQGCACVACDYKGRQREIIAPHEGECQDSSLKFQDSSVDGQKESEDTSISNSKISQKQETAEGPQTRNLNPETQNSKFEACENGILCEPDNVETLADALVKMLTDDDYRERVRKNAIERSKYYSIENTIDRWEKYLKQLE